MITIPNCTCFAGALLLIQDLLRSMHALHFYATKHGDFESENLLLAEWKILVEFEGIMRKAHELCFIVQGRRPEIAAELIVLLTLLKVHYEEGNVFYVIDTSCEKSWPATTPFRDLPRFKMTT